MVRPAGGAFLGYEGRVHLVQVGLGAGLFLSHEPAVLQGLILVEITILCGFLGLSLLAIDQFLLAFIGHEALVAEEAAADGGEDEEHQEYDERLLGLGLGLLTLGT